MAYEEVKFGTELHKFRLNEPVEGILKEIREDVGPNESTIYTVGDTSFWGASALDPLMKGAKVGQKVRVTLVNEAKKFPSGRIGREFKVEIDR